MISRYFDEDIHAPESNPASYWPRVCGTAEPVSDSVCLFSAILVGNDNLNDITPTTNDIPVYNVFTFVCGYIILYQMSFMHYIQNHTT